MSKELNRMIKFTVIAILLFSPISAGAGPVFWIGDKEGRLGAVDLDTGEVTVVGNMEVAMQDIAFDPDGNLWGVSHNSLYKIDKETAAQELVGKLGASRGSSLVFDSDGTLYTTYTTGLYTIDTKTGKASKVGFSGDTYRAAQDLAFIGTDLYMSAHRHGGVLMRVDKTDGATTLIGKFDNAGSIKGMASPNLLDLYGVEGTEILTIDPETAEVTILMNYADSGLGEGHGAAFENESAVPLPAAIWFLGSGLLAMVGIKKHRKKKL